MKLTGRTPDITRPVGPYSNGLSHTTDIWRETDRLGVVEVPADKLWGAQTQRSLEHVNIGPDLIQREIITAYARLKKAAAIAEHASKRLNDERFKFIVGTWDEIRAGQHHDMFPPATGKAPTSVKQQSDLLLKFARRARAERRINRRHPVLPRPDAKHFGLCSSLVVRGGVSPTGIAMNRVAQTLRAIDEVVLGAPSPASAASAIGSISHTPATPVGATSCARSTTPAPATQVES